MVQKFLEVLIKYRFPKFQAAYHLYMYVISQETDRPLTLYMDFFQFTRYYIKGIFKNKTKEYLYYYLFNIFIAQTFT